jgi:hypothetical protein
MAFTKIVKESTINKLLKIIIEDTQLFTHNKKAMKSTKKPNQLTFTDNIGYL